MRSNTLSLTFFLSLVAVLCLAPVSLAATVDVTTDRTSYAPGDAIVVSGTAPVGADVTIQVFNPNAQMVDIDYVTAAADGTFTKTVQLPSNPTSTWSLGSYTIKAFSSGASDQVSVTVQYQYAVTGKVVDASGAAISGATVKVGTSTGTSAADGSFAVSVAATGSYTLTVSKTGYVDETRSVNVASTTTNVGTITLVDLEDKVNELQALVANLTSKVDTLTANLNTANTTIVDLNARLTAVSNLQTQVTAIQNTATQLQASVAAVNSTLAMLPAFYALAFIGIIIAIIAVILVYRKIAK